MGIVIAFLKVPDQRECRLYCLALDIRLVNFTSLPTQHLPHGVRLRPHTNANPCIGIGTDGFLSTVKRRTCAPVRRILGICDVLYGSVLSGEVTNGVCVRLLLGIEGGF